MPLNATTYLTERGWLGKGVPLDGAAGRGLKKPIALPMKRGLRGLGKERDRAVEWWDCVFEAGAKKLSGSRDADGAAVKNGRGDNYDIAATSSLDDNLSLEARAKRAHARRMLMSGFVRGNVDVREQKQQEELERVLLEQQRASSSSRLSGSSEEGCGETSKMKAIMAELPNPDEEQNSLLEAKEKQRRKMERRRAKELAQGADHAPGMSKDAVRSKKRRRHEGSSVGGLVDVDKRTKDERRRTRGLEGETKMESTQLAENGNSKRGRKDKDRKEKKSSSRGKKIIASNGVEDHKRDREGSQQSGHEKRKSCSSKSPSKGKKRSKIEKHKDAI